MVLDSLEQRVGSQQKGWHRQKRHQPPEGLQQQVGLGQLAKVRQQQEQQEPLHR